MTLPSRRHVYLPKRFDVDAHMVVHAAMAAASTEPMVRRLLQECFPQHRVRCIWLSPGEKLPSRAGRRDDLEVVRAYTADGAPRYAVMRNRGRPDAEIYCTSLAEPLWRASVRHSTEFHRVQLHASHGHMEALALMAWIVYRHSLHGALPTSTSDDLFVSDDDRRRLVLVHGIHRLKVDVLCHLVAAQQQQLNDLNTDGATQHALRVLRTGGFYPDVEPPKEHWVAIRAHLASLGMHPSDVTERVRVAVDDERLRITLRWPCNAGTRREGHYHFECDDAVGFKTIARRSTDRTFEAIFLHALQVLHRSRAGFDHNALLRGTTDVPWRVGAGSSAACTTATAARAPIVHWHQFTHARVDDTALALPPRIFDNGAPHINIATPDAPGGPITMLSLHEWGVAYRVAGDDALYEADYSDPERADHERRALLQRVETQTGASLDSDAVVQLYV